MNIALKFSKLKFDQKSFLIDAIRNTLTEVEAHNEAIYDESYWDWQYEKLPTGKSLIYLAWDCGEIVGYYHVPTYYCSVNGVEKLIGNIQDVAVHPKYRQVGLFRQLAEFANEDLNNSEVDVAYTFPNTKSSRTFLKYNNFSLVSTIPALVRPVKLENILTSRISLFGLEKVMGWFVQSILNFASGSVSRPGASVEVSIQITDEIERLFTEYSSSFKVHLTRDKRWLKWRYLDSSRGKHHVLCVREKSELTAVVIFKEDEMLGNPALIVMDFAYLPRHEGSLLFIIDSVIQNKALIDSNFNLIFASSNSTLNTHLKRAGFYSIPSRFNPRVLNLLARNCSDSESEGFLIENDWLITLGDWDIF